MLANIRVQYILCSVLYENVQIKIYKNCMLPLAYGTSELNQKEKKQRRGWLNTGCLHLRRRMYEAKESSVITMDVVQKGHGKLL
jgi:hypothetical protein